MRNSGGKVTVREARATANIPIQLEGKGHVQRKEFREGEIWVANTHMQRLLVVIREMQIENKDFSVSQPMNLQKFESWVVLSVGECVGAAGLIPSSSKGR